MAKEFFFLVEINYKEANCCGAVRMILIRNGNSLGDSNIMDLLGVNLRNPEKLQYAMERLMTLESCSPVLPRSPWLPGGPGATGPIAM